MPRLLDPLDANVQASNWQPGCAFRPHCCSFTRKRANAGPRTHRLQYFILLPAQSTIACTFVPVISSVISTVITTCWTDVLHALPRRTAYLFRVHSSICCTVLPCTNPDYTPTPTGLCSALRTLHQPLPLFFFSFPFPIRFCTHRLPHSQT